MWKWKKTAGDTDWNKVSQQIPDDASKITEDGEWGKVSRTAVSWDVLSKDADAPDPLIGETKAERRRRETLEQEAAAREEQTRLATEEKARAAAAQRAQFATAEKARQEAEAEATKAERALKEAEEERNHEKIRKKQIRDENEKAEDTERRAGYKLGAAEAEKKAAQAELIEADAKQIRKGILTETFAQKAERVFRVVRPIALAILLGVGAIAGSIFMLRLAFMDVSRPSFPGGGNPPVTDPVDRTSPPAPDESGARKPPNNWGWDNYFDKDKQKVLPGGQPFQR